MKNRNTVLRARPLTIALRAALTTLAVASVTAPAAMADAALQKLIQPTNTISFGGIWVQHKSDLFGQYNGLEDSGASLLGDFSLRGGNGYGQQPGANTWFVQGKNLGTTSRSLSAGAADQGNWSLGLSFDQLRNYGGDSLVSSPGTFQTPLNGEPGGNVFTLPSSFGYIAEPRGAAGTDLITPGTTQAAFFHTDHLYVQRNTTKFQASHQLNKQWNVTFNWTNIRETGAILASSITDARTVSGVAGAPDPSGQKNLGLPYPTDYRTNNVKVALNWAGDNGFFTGAFYGSMFHDQYNSVWFPNPYTAAATTATSAVGGVYPMNAQSTPPSNSDNELQLSGGYNLNAATQLVGGYTYGRNTQNMAYGGYEPAQIGNSATDLVSLPVNSLDALVVNQHANWSITNRTTRDLTLSAGMIYSKRDNRTASNLYTFQAPDSSGAAGDDVFSVYNIPMSNSHLQTKAAADWRFTPEQRVHLAVQNEKILRWCDSTAYMQPGQLQLVDGSTVTPTGCAAVPESKENSAKLDYFLTPGGSLNFRGGVKWANRKSTLNPYYYNPLWDVSNGDQRDFPGWVAFFDASRRQVQGHFGVTWNASSAFDVSLDGAFGQDAYPDSGLGVQNGHDATVDLQGDYQFSDNATGSAYATWQMNETSSTHMSGHGYAWITGMKDQAVTLGASYKRTGMMADKLSLAADLSYSIDTNSTNSNVIATSTYNCSSSGASCGSAPDIRTKMTQLNLRGTYKLDKKSSVQVGYLFQRWDVSDYMFAAYQMGLTPSGTLPWNVQNPSVTQNAVYAEYTYSFQ